MDNMSNIEAFSVCLNIAKGCHDYQGGYHDKEKSEIYHHGIQTVVNCLQRLVDDGEINSLQLKIVHEIGKSK